MARTRTAHGMQVVLASLQGTTLGQAVRNRYLGPLLMSLVTLRDQVRWPARLHWSAPVT